MQTAPPVYIGIRNGPLRRAFARLLTTAGYDLAAPGDSRATILTTQAETTVEACAALSQAGRRVVVLMTSTSPSAREAYVAAGASCAEIGVPLARVLELLARDESADQVAHVPARRAG